MCDECGMWRLVYATRKLKAAEIRKLRGTSDDLSFSCGTDLQDAGLPAELEGVVYVKKMYCNEPIERLYYSANFDDICVCCAGDVPPLSNTEVFYPQCDNCADKHHIANVKSLKTMCNLYCASVSVHTLFYIFIFILLYCAVCFTVSSVCAQPCSCLLT